MVRYSIRPYGDDSPLRVISGPGGLSAVVTAEVAERFQRLVERARPRGHWQLKLLLGLAGSGRLPATAARLVRGGAAAYAGRYQRSLEALMCRAGARFVPGPRGGRWTGYYYLPADGE